MSKRKKIPEKYHERNSDYFRALLNGPYRMVGVTSMPGREGLAWRGDITENGEPIGYAHDEGRGGAVRVRIRSADADDRLRTWAANLPPEPRGPPWDAVDDDADDPEDDECDEDWKLDFALAELQSLAHLAASRAKHRKYCFIGGQIGGFYEPVVSSDEEFATWLPKKYPGAWPIPQSLLLAPPPAQRTLGSDHSVR